MMIKIVVLLAAFVGAALVAADDTESKHLHLRGLFNFFDANNDKKLSKEEFKTSLKPFGLTDTEVDEFFGKIDTSDDDHIDLNEFITGLTSNDALATTFMQRLSQLTTLTPEEIAGIAKELKKFDKNADDKFNKEELTEIMKSLGMEPSDADVDEIMKEIDDNKDGSIDASEFYTIFVNTKNKKVDELKAYLFKKGMNIPDDVFADYVSQFKSMDKDGNQEISSEELSAGITALGFEYNETRLKKVMKIFDVDNDDVIDLSEFIFLMKKLFNGKLTSSFTKEEFTKISHAFNEIDKNCNLKITKEKLPELLKSLEKDPADAKVKELMDTADTNGDGMIGFDELLNLLSQLK